MLPVESSFRKEPTGPLSGRSAEAPQSALSVSVPLLTGPVWSVLCLDEVEFLLTMGIITCAQRENSVLAHHQESLSPSA